MGAVLQLLIVEDSLDDVDLLLYALRRGGCEVSWQRVDNAQDMRAALLARDWDVITSDHAMPQFSAPAALALARELRPEIPLIIVSGEIDLDLAVSLMRDGALDYIQKHQLARLPSAIERTLREVATRREKQQIEQALRRSQRNFDLFFNTIDDLLFVLDRSGNILHVNQAVIRTLGYTEAELIGQHAVSMHPAERRSEAAHILAEMAAGRASSCPVPLAAKDGRQVPVETRVVAGEWNGDPALYSISHNISRLLLSEEKFSRAFHASPVLMAISTVAEGRYLDVNQAFLARLGFERQEVIGRTNAELGIYADPADLARPGGGEARLSDQTFELRLRTKSGEVLTGIFSATPMPIGDEACWLTTLTDISERKLMEEKLAASEQKFALAFGFNPDPTAVFAIGAGTFVEVNQALIDLSGYAKDELIGRSVNQLGFWAQTEERDRALDLMRRQGRVDEYPLHLQTRSGRLIEVLCSARRISQNGQQYLFARAHVVTDVQRAEAALYASEQRYRLALEASKDGLWDWDVPSGKVVYSPAYFAMLGLPVGQFPPDVSTWLDLIHPADRQRTWQINADCINGKTESFEVLYRMRHQSGEWRWILGRGRCVERQSDGRALRMVGTHTDMTAYQQSQDQLADTKATLDAAIEQTPIPMVLVSVPDNVIHYVNRACLEFLDYQDEPSLVGASLFELNQTWQDYDHEGNPVPLSEMPLARAMGGEKVLMREYSVRTKNGVQRWELVTSAPIFNAQGRQIAAFAIFPDISDRKRVERELRLRTEELDIFFEVSLDLLCIADIEGHFRRVNSQWQATLGYTEQELLAVRYLDIIHPDDLPATLESLQRLQSSVEILNLINRYRCKDGGYRWIEWRSYPVGKLIYAVARDITERKLAEEQTRRLNVELEQRVLQRTAQLEAANQELEIANQELAAFTYSVSHDLHAPLRTMDGYSSILLKDFAAQLDGQAVSYLQRIREAALRMRQLIDDLLRLSRITRAEVHREAVNLSQLAQALATELGEGQPERAVTWVIAPQVTANADPDLMRIVLDNFLRNAWKFTARHAAARIEFGCEMQHGERTYFVRDDGAGFDMRYADKLFMPFQRLHTSQEFDGSGIGLATVQRIIRLHAGRVWAVGAVEQGATFYFTLAEKID